MSHFVSQLPHMDPFFSFHFSSSSSSSSSSDQLGFELHGKGESLWGCSTVGAWGIGWFWQYFPWWKMKGVVPPWMTLWLGSCLYMLWVWKWSCQSTIIVIPFLKKILNSNFIESKKKLWLKRILLLNNKIFLDLGWPVFRVSYRCMTCRLYCIGLSARSRIIISTRD